MKDQRYIIHPDENIIIRGKKPPQEISTQSQVINDSAIRKNQNIFRNENPQIEVKSCPKTKKPIFKKHYITFPSSPICQQKNCIEFARRYYCQNCEFINTKTKISNRLK